MIANIMKGSGFAGIARYHQSKIENGKACLLGATGQLEGKDLKEIGAFLDRHISQYKQMKQGEPGKPMQIATFHPSVNFAPGEYIDNQTMMNVARDYMDGMGYGNNDYAVVRHNDKPHEHFHIIACRVNNDFHLVGDSLERVKSRELSRKLEKKYGLINAETKARKQGKSQPANFNYQMKQWINDKVQEQAGKIRETVSLGVDYASEKESLFRDFVNRLKKDSITLERTEKGICFYCERDGKKIRFKGSDLPGNYTLSSLERTFAGQRATAVPDAKDNLRRALFAVLRVSRSFPEFEKNCNQQGVTIKLSENKGGVYGIRFTKDGADYKGSDLAKRLTWGGISAALKENALKPEPLTAKTPEHAAGTSGRIRSAWQGIARNMDGGEDDEEGQQRKKGPGVGF